MLNAERFRNELLEILSENRYIEVDKYDRKIRKCTGNNCPKCMFGITALGKGRDSCSIAAMLWLLSEYKEPIKLTRLEYEILKYILNHTEYKYITRDRLRAIFIYENKPEKCGDTWRVLANGGGYTNLTILDELFPFIKWEDSTPTSIQEVLENCEVVEDAEEL